MDGDRPITELQYKPCHFISQLLQILAPNSGRCNQVYTAKTTPIQQDGTLDTQPPYGRRGGATIIGGKPSALANSFGLQFFTDDNGGGNAAAELEQGEIPAARLRPSLTGSSAAVTLSSGGTAANRLHSSGPCCALPFPVTQAHNIDYHPLGNRKDDSK
ncbi:hypothetical protein V9T40_006193 [Parthenolecanium corni]|uniref:Uncharacterized protein n=1 Tax=Parthenolecanium corni TaxID=536013 RepID=A0AAN9TWC1_9HEMI